MSRSYPHDRLYLKDSIALGEGTSNALIVFQKKDRKLMLGIAQKQRNFRGKYTTRSTRSWESNFEMMIGKPYSGAKLD